MKNRFFLIIGGIVLLLIIGIGISASSPRNTDTYGKIYTVTVNSDIGLSYVVVQNLNTGSTWTILQTELPYRFNCTSGDTLSFTANAIPGYVFNTWLPNSGIPYSLNPYTVKANAAFSLVAKFKPASGQP